MRAIVCENGSFTLRKHAPEPRVPPGEALLRIHTVGVGRAEREQAAAYTGIAGHEFVATVEQAPDSRWVGKRVVGEAICPCGTCDLCQRGLAAHCRKRTILGQRDRPGALADRCTLPQLNLHEVPANLGDEEAIFTAPLAAALQVTRQAPVDSRTRATILGDGPLGQLVAQVLKLSTPHLLLVGMHPHKLEPAERLGVPTRLLADVTVRADQDVVVDCTGQSSGLATALRFIRPRGTIVLKTTADAAAHLAPVVMDEITILGSGSGPYAQALHLLATRQISVAGLISHRSRAEQAADLLNQPPADALKIAIDFTR